MYSQLLLDHFREPKNVGEMDSPAVRVDVSNPACGDMMRLSARFENGRVVEAMYKTRGCTASIATGSALTELIQDKSIEELARLTAAEVEDAVGGLTPESRHAAVLCVDGVKALIKAAPCS